jgi:hypothetical protein
MHSPRVSCLFLTPLVVAILAVALVSPDAYGQARGGGRVSTREDINRATAGGGLQGVATNQAQAGGGLSLGEGGAAGGGGALSMGDSGNAGAGGGLGVKAESEEDAALRAGGDLLGGKAKSASGGMLAAEEEGSSIRTIATWVPIIGAVALALTAFFLRYMKGRKV